MNVSVLVLRKDRVEHDHFRTWAPLPVLGAIVCVIVVVQTLLQESNQPVFVRAGALMVLGVLLWIVNRLAPGDKRDTDLEGLEE